jgi:hypothetical protein
LLDCAVYEDTRIVMQNVTKRIARGKRDVWYCWLRIEIRPIEKLSGDVENGW